MLNGKGKVTPKKKCAPQKTPLVVQLTDRSESRQENNKQQLVSITRTCLEIRRPVSRVDIRHRGNETWSDEPQMP